MELFLNYGSLLPDVLKAFPDELDLQERDDTNRWGQQLHHLFQLHPRVLVTQHPQDLQLCPEAKVSQQTAQQCLSWKKSNH